MKRCVTHMREDLFDGYVNVYKPKGRDGVEYGSVWSNQSVADRFVSTSRKLLYRIHVIPKIGVPQS